MLEAARSAVKKAINSPSVKINIMNSDTATPQSHSNRRPGPRTRCTIPSEAATTTKTAPTVVLPSSLVHPPPQLRQVFQSMLAALEIARG